MLGALALLAMLAGAMATAGAVFDWEFFFSDGRTPHLWPASLSRSAARTLIGLGGGGLLAVGFVLRVIAVANIPLDTSPAFGGSTNSSATFSATADRIAERPAAASQAPGAVKNLDHDRGASSPAATTRDRQPTSGAETASAASPPPPESALQAVTIWNPTATLEPQGTTLFTLEYRFEAGHRPRAGEHYTWMIDLSDKTRVVQYEGDFLQAQGQLRHVIQTPAELANGLGTWHTIFLFGSDDSAQEVSNRLTISGDRVQSTPLASP